MSKLFASIVPLALAAIIGVGPAFAAEEEGATPHYPIKMPKEVDWSFAGPFGTFDKGQLQRGLKVYVEVCSACHSLDMVAFRNLEDLGYSEDQVKSFAANYEVEDGPDADGEMFSRTAVASDYFPSPYANEAAAASVNNGAPPPDFSLLAKARYVERGFPQFIFDIFTGYSESGPNYIYSLLTGYEEPPHGMEVAEGTYYNPYYLGGPALAMAEPISDEQVTYDDGAPETLDQYSKDVSAFLMWAAEPHMEERKHMGFMVIVFLAIFTALMFLTKKAVFSRKEH
ncbi:cytochrome c1 [Hoeflea sp. YIM 152468]|uniref:cytochrome c1 n=1 Tax=Hoeflea sp. YIM 152468 TaxID=3031759 RepID=UPI0023DCE38C|nr:cytochrome c1 [Hoeflea sp. YIM 152468]MDF1609696.1 cytochrome c1 [Hoeflea sp. YIM 152468]